MSTLSMTYNDENNCDCLGFKFNISQENAATRESYQHLENNEVDKILVQGMSSLSFNERQREQDDLHGVSAEFIERTDEMDHVLGLVQNKLNMIKHGTAYELAEAMNLSYVSDRNFRMPFLRANRYNPQEAADQMIRHFDLKQKLFGRDKLTKDIATSDLSDDDIKPLIGGSYHISKVRDRAGRLILLKFPKLRDYKSVENELRGRFYFYTELVKSLDSETRGVVMINYSVGQFRDTSVHGLVENVKLTFAMPFFLSGIHLCFDHQSDILLGKSGLSLVSPQVAARTKIHYGSHLECQYSLGTFGIPATVLPLDITQTDSILAYQLSWYQDCLEKETAYDDQGKPTPNENDVLCLGRKVNSRGNERLLHMASLHQDWYNAGDAKERKILVDLIMESIRKKGGRFLKPDGGDRLNLKELPVDEIREKIAQMFRNVKKRNLAHARKKSSRKPLEVVGIVDNINENDVLFGRKCDHPGNETLRSLINSMSAEYNCASRGRKKEIADFVVAEIKRNEGRFLKLADNGKWCEVSDKVAEMKVSSHFRNSRRISKKQG